MCIFPSIISLALLFFPYSSKRRDDEETRDWKRQASHVNADEMKLRKMQVAAKCIGFGITINKISGALLLSHTRATFKEQQQKWRWRRWLVVNCNVIFIRTSVVFGVYIMYTAETICCVESRGTEADSLFPNCNKFARASTHKHTLTDELGAQRKIFHFQSSRRRSDEYFKNKEI